MTQLSFEKDDWLTEIYEFHPYWVARLDNGLEVYQDDDRDGVTPHSAWERLGLYCFEKNVKILDFKLKWRSYTITVGENADGYFFCKSLLAGLSGPNTYYYLLGTLKDNKLLVTKYRMPDLVKEEEEYRDPNSAGICLIRN